jgi:hypothetical protein
MRNMTDVYVNELGSVDYVVVEFPPGVSNFSGEVAKEIGRLVEANVVRVLPWW